MKRKILASAVLAALLSTTALADTSSMNADVTGMGILENDYVRAGVNGNTGTFGSGGNTSPGLLFDSTGTGDFNTSYDYLTPGSPFDGFSVKIDGTNYTNNNGGGTAITGDGNGLTDGDNALSWTGGVDSVFDITNTYSLGATSPYIDISSQITMGVDATDVYFGRFIDPDARAAAGDSSATDNVLGYGAIPDSNVAFSEATVSRYALGLYSTDSNVDAGISMWSSEADAYTENTVDGDGSLTNTGDNTIGLSWHWTDVGIGDILTASYAYIFGPSAFEAAGDAIEGGAGGGADILTGTFEDVGSATDAAESGGTPAEPTLVSTSDWVASTTPSDHTDTEGDTLELGTSHVRADYSERTYVDTATTEFTRTNTYATTATETYSDSSTREITGTTTGDETYLHIVTVEANDILASTTPGESTSVSQGYDTSTFVDTVEVETVDENNTFNATVTIERTGEEVFEVTTPTVHTYNRTTTTTTEDDFADDSYYADTSSETTATSTVSETYDIVTEAREDRVGGIILDVNTDSNQDKVVLDLQKNLARGVTFGTVGVEGYDHSYGIYKGNTKTARLGGTRDLDNGARLGAGVHISNSSIKGNTGAIDINSTQIGATLSRETNGWDVSGTVQHTETESTVKSTPVVTARTYGTNIHNETISIPGIPAIEADGKGSNTSVSVLAKGPGDTFRPIIGGTLGREEVDSINYSISGVDLWNQTGKDDTYGYATIGGELTLGLATITALHHTDGVNDVALGLEKEGEKFNWRVEATRSMTNLGDTNSLSAGISWKF
jgi:hypothetical protein